MNSRRDTPNLFSSSTNCEMSLAGVMCRWVLMELFLMLVSKLRSMLTGFSSRPLARRIRLKGSRRSATSQRCRYVLYVGSFKSTYFTSEIRAKQSVLRLASIYKFCYHLATLMRICLDVGKKKSKHHKNALPWRIWTALKLATII